MKDILLVFLGGGLGSVGRYGIALLLKPLGNTFPYGTLIANVLACFIIGFLTAALSKNTLTDYQRLLWATGFCGGLSTFSTFSNETIQLYQNGQWISAILNIAISFIVCLLATLVGLRWS